MHQKCIEHLTSEVPLFNWLPHFVLQQAKEVIQCVTYGGFIGQFQQQTQHLERLQTFVPVLVALPMYQLEEGYSTLTQHSLIRRG